MPWKSDPEAMSALVAFLVATVSGLVAIATRVGAGQKFSWLWFVSQLGGALLAGYLAWDVYPHMTFLPAWCTQPLVVSIAAHYGGKIFSIAEVLIGRRLNISPDEIKP